MKSGIYTITNTVNGKMYVGQALSLTKRWLTHKNALNTKMHRNSYLQAAWNKYGESAFIFEILVECEEKYLYSEEHYWCNMLQVHNRQRGYNIQPTTPFGIVRMSEETKKKIGDSNRGRGKGRKLSEETRKKISAARKGRPGKKWTEQQRIESSQRQKGIPLSKERAEALNKVRTRKPVYQKTMDGTVIKIWDSTTGLKINGIGYDRGIRQCCRGERKSYKGYIWEYVKEKHKNKIDMKKWKYNSNEDSAITAGTNRDIVVYIDGVHPDAVERIVEMYNEGYSLSKIKGYLEGNESVTPDECEFLLEEIENYVKGLTNTEQDKMHGEPDEDVPFPNNLDTAPLTVQETEQILVNMTEEVQTPIQQAAPEQPGKPKTRKKRTSTKKKVSLEDMIQDMENKIELAKIFQSIPDIPFPENMNKPSRELMLKFQKEYKELIDSYIEEIQEM